MYTPMYSPENGPFPPHIENSRITLHRTALDGGNDVALRDGYIYLINNDGGGTLRICTADTDTPAEVSTVTGLGNTRQIEVGVIGGKIIAAVTARESGLFLIDVTDPHAPHICCHYNTVEFATGVAVCENYIFIGSRSFGVEIIDASDTESPRHISTIRAGEVQSVFVSEGILYTGSWGQRQVNIFDVSNAARPKFLATIPLEGRGDGLCVRDGILYAAFGQHRPPASGNDPEEYGYGRGNGFGIWDVRDPAAPKCISVTFFPIRYYAHWDLWDVTLCNNYAVITHTMNGVWIYDISAPEAPVLCEHIGITTDASVGEIFNTDDELVKSFGFKFPFDPAHSVYAPVTGTAVSDGRLYIAVKFQNLHVASGDIFTKSADSACGILSSGGDYYDNYPGNKPGEAKIVKACGQVHGAAYLNGRIYAACGMGGVEIFDSALSAIGHFDTDGFAFDIREHGGYIYIAAGKSGIIICRPEGDGLTEVGAFLDIGASFSQVVPSANGRFLMVHRNDRDLSILDITDKASPRQVMLEHYEPGLIYHRQISYSGVDGRYYGCYQNNNLTRWYDLSGDTPVLTHHTQGKLGFVEGITGLSDPHSALVVTAKGICVYDIRENLRYSELSYTPIEGIRNPIGKPVVSGSTLYISNRLSGSVYICDITDVRAPKLIRSYNFSGHPDLVCPTPHGAVIPLGHQGIALCPAGDA